MRSTRLRRIDDQMKRILGEALITEVMDPRIGFVTVTGVKVSKEFDTAKVFVSVLGDEHARSETMSGLRSAGPYLQSRIGKAMRLRRIPLLRFIYDDSVERSMHIGQLLRDAEATSGDGAEVADGSDAGSPLADADPNAADPNAGDPPSPDDPEAEPGEERA
ncbi:MAG: hypothetical protein DHS20C21_07100 [Gemmatimonadota bacterium]|nr:MAG: hypothetical protein DHS20C21_07100 [Gemmatimonadota bacterium]